ncbi:MAG TPA: ABC transporter permease [Spirochaetota bacterium]|nr:ABC transporter permease [Spirochaetota bacterium]HSA15091.1 ABC transporter permease [Spirochaetota bacterium]
MNLKNSFKTATKSLGKNKMRTTLTSIGVIIGVSSVIIMIGIGSSAQVAVREKILTYGVNAISVQTNYKQFTIADLEKISSTYYQVKYFTPISYSKNMLIKYFNKNQLTGIWGVNNDYFKMKNWPLKFGRYFSEYEIISNEKVAIIGHTVQKNFFPFSDPLEKIILIDNLPYRVIGVLTEMGTALSGRDFDDIVIIPYTTSLIKIKGIKQFEEFFIGVHSENQIDDMVKSLHQYFRRLHPPMLDKRDPVRIQTSKEKLEMAESISRYLSYLLAGIASISLFVGGVGIMNIMLVSVSERTREIGIRMAIGAKSRDILLQFLVESVILSSMGGIAGIIIGISVYYTITYFIHWPFVFSLSGIMLSFLFSCAVGITFGYYPAKKASSLNPIDALRTE